MKNHQTCSLGNQAWDLLLIISRFLRAPHLPSCQSLWSAHLQFVPDHLLAEIHGVEDPVDGLLPESLKWKIESYLCGIIKNRACYFFSKIHAPNSDEAAKKLWYCIRFKWFRNRIIRYDSKNPNGNSGKYRPLHEKFPQSLIFDKVVIGLVLPSSALVLLPLSSFSQPLISHRKQRTETLQKQNVFFLNNLAVSNTAW